MGHIHDRMPLMVERERWGGLARPHRVTDKDDLLALLVPAAPGALEAFPVSTAVSNVRNNGPELVEPLPLDDVPELADPAWTAASGPAKPRRHPARRGRGWSPPVAPPGRRRCCSATAPAAASTPATSRRWRRTCRGDGVTVVRFEQPWRVAGGKVATPPPTLDAALVAAAEQLRTRTPLVVGGRSAGARSAARTARSLGASGCLALSFPLHPPGRPEKSRLDELLGAGVPTLVVQGENDPFGRPEEFPDGVAPRLASCRTPTTGSPSPKRGAAQRGRRDGRRRRGDAGVDRPRGRRESLDAAAVFLSTCSPCSTVPAPR